MFFALLSLLLFACSRYESNVGGLLAIGSRLGFVRVFARHVMHVSYVSCVSFVMRSLKKMGLDLSYF